MSDLQTVWRACLSVLSEMGDRFDEVRAHMHPGGTELHPYPHVSIGYQLAGTKTRGVLVSSDALGQSLCDPGWSIARNLREQIANMESWEAKNMDAQSKGVGGKG